MFQKRCNCRHVETGMNSRKQSGALNDSFTKQSKLGLNKTQEYSFR